jgi:2-methylcitrate dehydratase PrpD
MGLTREIGEFVAGTRFVRLPSECIRIVTLGFTDCLAVMVPGWSEPVARIAARVFGHADDVPAPDRALLYAVAAHALDYDDTGLLGHPSAVLVSAILAEADEIAVDGKAAAAAYAAGYELWAELIRRDHDQHHAKGWHPTAMFGSRCGRGVRLAATPRRHASEPGRRHGGVVRRRHRRQFRIDDQAAPGRPRRAVGRAGDAAGGSRQ